MIRRLIILLLIVGCDYAPTEHSHEHEHDTEHDKTYKCEVDCETTLVDAWGDTMAKSCSRPLLGVDALDIDEAEEYCYDWYELDSLNNADFTYSCNCEVFN